MATRSRGKPPEESEGAKRRPGRKSSPVPIPWIPPTWFEASDRRMPDSIPPRKADLTPEERDLGMGAPITRRDFLNTVALGTGAALLGMPAPALRGQPVSGAPSPPAGDPASPWHPWTGNPGIGDYAISNGNTWDVVSAAHGLRDGTYERAMAGATDTGETYDLVIVGGGFAGTVAAYQFLKAGGRERSCLLLDNHPIIG